VRVCSGIAKGIILKSPRGMGVRPTSAKVRQAIFAVLSHRIVGSCVLDLYAGTGALGIEALSRGAAEAVFVETSPGCVRIIRENLLRTNLSAQATVLTGDALRTIRQLGKQNRTFDVIMADPPYETNKPRKGKPSLAQKTLQVLVESDILRSDSLVILEHSGMEGPAEGPAGLRLLSRRQYGSTSVSIFTPT
jgi:16S rRNA (guanine966-N2)-methyltransferase